MEIETDYYDEYRAVVHQPASWMDDAESQERGYVEYRTSWTRREPGMPKDAFISSVRASCYGLRRSEETHAGIVGWERREVLIETTSPVSCDDPV